MFMKEFVNKIRSLNENDLNLLFEAFFTKKELQTLEKRYELIKKLISGMPQRQISKELKISISQITRGSKELKYGSGSRIFKKLFNKNVLEEIIQNKKKEVDKIKSFNIELVKNFPEIESFYEAILKSRFAIIAEIKKKSPSCGIITNYSIKEIAKEYLRSNIECISVLTDKKYFNGDFKDIEKIRKITKIPILCKDFIIDKKQIYQARKSGASAVLLIVKVLMDINRISELMKFASEFGMDSLIEINDEEELKIAINSGAKIIGINSRNLETLEINNEIVKNLMPKIPKNILKIALSGISNGNQIKEIKDICNGVLIGTSLCSLKPNEIKTKINEFRLSI